MQFAVQSIRRMRQTQSRHRYPQQATGQHQHRSWRVWDPASSPYKPIHSVSLSSTTLYPGPDASLGVGLAGRCVEESTYLVDGVKVLAELREVNVGLDDIGEGHVGAF